MSVGALLMCAALSLICAGLLTTVYMQKKQAEHAMEKLRSDEAIHMAILRFVPNILSSTTPDRVTGSEVIGDQRVELRAESEALKWPFSQIDELTDVELASRSHLTLKVIQSLKGKEGALPVNDCFRSLFSDLGQLALSAPVPRFQSLIMNATAKDSEIWRIRAVMGGQVVEQRVRFLGDTNKLFALISQDTYSLGEMPTCTKNISP